MPIVIKEVLAKLAQVKKADTRIFEDQLSSNWKRLTSGKDTLQAPKQ
jgi:hypothetical protein